MAPSRVLPVGRRGFTLVELLVVIAIIGLLSTVAVVSLSSARAKARDTKRLADMRQIMTALELYKDINGTYPGNTDSDTGCGGWDMGYFGGPTSGDQFIQPLKTAGLINTPGDPVASTCPGVYPDGYAYYLYPAGNANCDASFGAFYVLGIRNMETSSGAYPSSPGWSCPLRNWQSEFEWVTGAFEKS
jgi:prepilin-type N-terminal cleavage/methylation domain-containing protein